MQGSSTFPFQSLGGIQARERFSQNKNASKIMHQNTYPNKFFCSLESIFWFKSDASASVKTVHDGKSI